MSRTITDFLETSAGTKRQTFSEHLARRMEVTRALVRGQVPDIVLTTLAMNQGPGNRKNETKTAESDDRSRPKTCSKCGAELEFTGQPNLSGPVYFHIYRCENCGLVRLPVREESPEGWG